MIRDLQQIHKYWMNLMFDRHIDPHPVTGKEEPNTIDRKVLMLVWKITGIPASLAMYPIAILGLGFRRLVIDKIGNFADENSLISTISLLLFVWGLLSFISYQFGAGEEAFSVAISSIVAITSASASYIIRNHGGMKLNILVGYPLAYTAIFLPPVTFAMVHSTGGSFVFELSSYIVISFKNMIAEPLGIRTFISRTFDLVGYNYVVLWLFISCVCGWFTGISVKITRILK